MLLTIVSRGSLAILCQCSETRPKNKLTIASNRRQVVILPRRAAGRLSRRRHSCPAGRPWVRRISGVSQVHARVNLTAEKGEPAAPFEECLLAKRNALFSSFHSHTACAFPATQS